MNSQMTTKKTETDAALPFKRSSIATPHNGLTATATFSGCKIGQDAPSSVIRAAWAAFVSEQKGFNLQGGDSYTELWIEEDGTAEMKFCQSISSELLDTARRLAKLSDTLVERARKTQCLHIIRVAWTQGASEKFLLIGAAKPVVADASVAPASAAAAPTKKE